MSRTLFTERAPDERPMVAFGDDRPAERFGTGLQSVTDGNF
jgi:hypothetical protein